MIARRKETQKGRNKIDARRIMKKIIRTVISEDYTPNCAKNKDEDYKENNVKNIRIGKNKIIEFPFGLLRHVDPEFFDRLNRRDYRLSDNIRRLLANNFFNIAKTII